MPNVGDIPALFTDMYQLAMAEAYFGEGRHETPACFDYFLRDLPEGWGYVVFAGLEDALKGLENFRFDPEAIGFLKKRGLGERFLEYLRHFRFQGDVYAAEEGDVVFPVRPVVRVEGGLLEAQIVETFLLNFLNFESLVATKAARVRSVAPGKIISEFGLRRAQGLGGLHASRAAVIGGCDTTSNVLAAFMFHLEPAGTMSHSYVQSWGNELEAFRHFAAAHPDNAVLLVDTYDSLRMGVPNAITVGKELAKKGKTLKGIRIDSGDLGYIAKEARRMLDVAGLRGAKIVASNQLDEFVIKSLMEQGAPIDAFGVGTRLATGHPAGALDGVYKLSQIGGKPCLKFSESTAKMTLPGKKQVWRCLDPAGFFAGDCVALEEEREDVPEMFHPADPGRKTDIREFQKEAGLRKVMEAGKRLFPGRRVETIARFARSRLDLLPPEHKRFDNPHIYKVGISAKLMALRGELNVIFSTQ